MKRIKNFLFIITILLSSLIHPVYAEESMHLTIDDYIEAINKEAKKYDIDVWVNDYNALGEITEEKIDEGIKNVRIFATSLHTESNNTSISNISSTNTRASSSRKRTGYFDIVAAPGAATINVDITASINTSNNRVTSVSKKTAYQSGVAFFFSSWTTHSIKTQLNDPSTGYVSATVTGYAVFNYGGVSYASNMSGACIIDFK